jgi:hypothetical protein
MGERQKTGVRIVVSGRVNFIGNGCETTGTTAGTGEILGLSTDGGKPRALSARLRIRKTGIQGGVAKREIPAASGRKVEPGAGVEDFQTFATAGNGRPPNTANNHHEHERILPDQSRNTTKP